LTFKFSHILFFTLQDTVIGLQGLAQIAKEIYQPTFTPITVQVDWTTFGEQSTRTLMLDDSTKLLLQSVEVPVMVRYWIYST
jgi:hypothetical protein